MPGMYPDDQVLEIFGERVLYPGLDPVTRKFTDGDFSDPLKKPSHIPAATFNLMLDNMESLISAMGLDPNNTDPEQLKNAVQKGFAPRRVGEIVMLAYEPSVMQLIKMRIVPLKGQLLQIALYQDLFDLMYAGDGNNNTAPWWYRCHIDGDRSITGQYFRPVDMRGLFPRAAGQNSYYRTDMSKPMSTPYVRRLQSNARFCLSTTNDGALLFKDPTGCFYTAIDDNVTLQAVASAGGGVKVTQMLYFDSNRATPSAHENRPASISALICISY